MGWWWRWVGGLFSWLLVGGFCFFGRLFYVVRCVLCFCVWLAMLFGFCYVGYGLLIGLCFVYEAGLLFSG